MSFFTPILARAYAAVAAALLCFILALWLQNAALKAKVKDQDRVIANLQVDLRQCQSNRVTLEAAIKDSNAAVERMKAEAEARRKEGERAVREARRQTVEANRRADRVARQVSRDVCGDDLITESLG